MSWSKEGLDVFARASCNSFVNELFIKNSTLGKKTDIPIDYRNDQMKKEEAAAMELLAKRKAEREEESA